MIATALLTTTVLLERFGWATFIFLYWAVFWLVVLGS